MTTDSCSLSRADLIAALTDLISKEFTICKFFTPAPSTILEISTFCVDMPCADLPEPGWSWWPVMAVVPLSSIITVILASL